MAPTDVRAEIPSFFHTTREGRGGEGRRGERRRGVETAGLRCRRLKAEGQGRPDLQTAELQVIKVSFHLSVLFRVDSV